MRRPAHFNRLSSREWKCHSKLCAIIDTCKEYPADPHLFCDTPVTLDLVRAFLELGPCQPDLKDNLTVFQKMTVDVISVQLSTRKK